MNSRMCLVPGCHSLAAAGVVVGESPCTRICELRTLNLCQVHAGVIRFGLVAEILTTVGFEIVAQFPLRWEAETNMATGETETWIGNSGARPRLRHARPRDAHPLPVEVREHLKSGQPPR